MEFIKENWLNILMLTPLVYNTIYIIYIIIQREVFTEK